MKERLFRVGMITDTVARTVECRKGSDCSLGRHLIYPTSLFFRVPKATVWRRSEQRTQNQNGIRSVRPRVRQPSRPNPTAPPLHSVRTGVKLVWALPSPSPSLFLSFSRSFL